MPRLTEEQIAKRRTFIGASDIGAIAGLNPYKDAFAVLNEKLGYAIEGETNEAAEWGHRLEPVVRAWYAEQEGVRLIPCGTVTHPGHPHRGATLDSKVLESNRGLEVKVVGGRMMFDWDPHAADGIPHYVRAQCAWQMHVIGLDAIDVAALLGGTDARIWRVERDAELEATLVALGTKFWCQCVIGGLAPTTTDSADARTYLDGKYPPPPQPVRIDADEAMAAAVFKRADAIARRDEADREQRQATYDAIQWLGAHGATDAIGDEWEFRYRVRKDGMRQPWFKRKGDRR